MLETVLNEDNFVAVLFISKPSVWPLPWFRFFSLVPPKKVSEPRFLFFSSFLFFFFLHWYVTLFSSDDLVSVGTDVLEWLSDEETRKLDDDIEEVNANMLDFILATNPYVAVIFTGKICFWSKNVDWEEWPPPPSPLN